MGRISVTTNASNAIKTLESFSNVLANLQTEVAKIKLPFNTANLGSASSYLGQAKGSVNSYVSSAKNSLDFATSVDTEVCNSAASISTWNS